MWNSQIALDKWFLFGYTILFPLTSGDGRFLWLLTVCYAYPRDVLLSLAELWCSYIVSTVIWDARCPHYIHSSYYY